MALTAVLTMGAIGVAVAETVQGSSDQIIEFGPVDATTGYPTWYRDAGFEHQGKTYDSVDLEPCVGDTDPLCLPAPLPKPGEPASVKTLNMPGEFFYYHNGAAGLTSNGGNLVLFESALEGAWSAEEVKDGDQVVFGRIRIRVEGLQPGSEYTVTHPQGVDRFTADAGKRGINYTQDIAAAPQVFNAAFKSRVGPFLRWAPNADDPNDAPPAGYIGDPAADHKVIGSPFATNYVKVTGDQVGAPDNNPGANASPCPAGLWDGPVQDCIYTDLFNLTGKLSKTGGVDTNRATYHRTADGTTAIDVFSRSKGSQKMVVQDASGSRFPDAKLLGWQGRYFAHVNVAGQLTDDDLGSVKVVNQSDDPDTVQQVDLNDLVTVTGATYDTDTQKLTVKAQSSDRYAGQATLTLPDHKGAQLADGTVTVDDVKVAPATVKVASSEGGTGVGQVVAQGSTSAPKLEAFASGPGSAEQAQKVTLSAANATGNITGYEWTYEQAPGGPDVTLADATSETPSFTAPTLAPMTSEATLTFAVKVTGAIPAGGTEAPTSTAKVTVKVLPVRAPRAVVAQGTALTVAPGAALTLDGTRSTGAATFAWTDAAAPDIVLGTAPTLPFTVPQTGPVTLRLTVTNAAGDTNTTTIQVDVASQGTITPGKARYIEAKRRWVVDGTASALAGNTVTVHAGPTLDGPVIGTATVATAGAAATIGTWAVDALDSPVTLGDAECGPTVYCVSIEASRGGQALGLAVERADRLPAPNHLPADQQPTTQAAPAAGVAAQGVAGVTATGPGIVAAAGAVPLLGAARAVLVLAAPATVNATTVTTGIPVTVNVPAGATLLRLRVLTTAGAPLFSAFSKVKGGTKVKLKVKSAKLRRSLRAGKRYVIEVRTGTSRTRLGKATRKQFRVRR
ncbi:MAG: hypothetical protein QOF04_683 [Solirubrobacteraceae bacterium]|nr:hypothetical protein [Solirubrobacteraceae bacterium]